MKTPAPASLVKVTRALLGPNFCGSVDLVALEPLGKLFDWFRFHLA